MSTISIQKRSIFACLVMVLCLALFLSAFFHARKVEQDHARLIFERRAENYTAHIQRELYRSIEVIESIESFYSASVRVERDEFRAFVAGPLSLHPEIQALEWIPRVTADQRAVFEERARRSGMAGFQFTERLEQGVMARAKPRKTYYPVSYVEPQEGNEAALGFDLGSDPLRLKAINRSGVTGKMTTSARVRLVQGEGNQFGFLILKPLYAKGAVLSSPEERLANLLGFTLGAYSVADLVKKSLNGTAEGELEFYLLDETDSTDLEFLYYYSTDPEKVEAEPALEMKDEINESFHFSTRLSVPGRKWSLLFYPVGDILQEGPGNAWWILAGGFLLTALLGVFFLFVIRHARKVENLMLELTVINNELEKEMLERRRVEGNLQASVAEKEILLQEIHHRVKNNLQMVSGLLNLQARHIDDQKARKIYIESENRVMSMALIHENLYGSKDLGRVSFPEYIQSLSRNISSTYGKEKGEIKILFDIEKAHLVMDTAIPAGLVVNELVTNAFQHAFPDDSEGEIYIGFSVAEGNVYTLTVKDNGTGMAGTLRLDGYRSLGLSLVKTLVELLNGQIEVNVQDGTSFVITFREYREAGVEMH